MSSPQSKQHIDLIRHRELNALRMLMAQKLQTEQPIQPSSIPTLMAPRHQAMAQIAALEAQMTDVQKDAAQGAATQFTASTAIPTLTQIEPLAAEQAVIQAAAALFADNQIALAQTRLEQAIAPSSALAGHVPTWLALLDLYRATNQAALFDASALDFAIRFGRSTPSWISFIHLAAQSDASLRSVPSPAAQVGVLWVSPHHFTANDAADLTSVIHGQVKQAQPLTLDWRAVSSVDADAWASLLQSLQQLAQTKLICYAYGGEALERLCTNEQAATCLTRMAWLRCQNLSQAYEDAAIEYCGAFEVSPPDWVAPLCQLSTLDAAGMSRSHYVNMPVFKANDVNTAKSTIASSLYATGSLALVGEVTARLPAVFVQYPYDPAKGIGHKLEIDIACEALVRCDLQATLELKLWASAMHAQGKVVTLMQPHRLVAAFFLSQGIYAFAKVTPRKD